MIYKRFLQYRKHVPCNIANTFPFFNNNIHVSYHFAE